MHGPDWLRAARTAAAERFGASPMPTDTEEIWRYSPIGDLDLDRFEPHGAERDAAAPATEPPAMAVDLATALGTAGGTLALTNGGLDLVAGLPDRATAFVGRLGDHPDGAALLGSVAGEHDIFSMLNVAFSPDPIIIDVPKGVVLGGPLILTHSIGGASGDGQGGASSPGTAVFPRTVIRLGVGAEAHVVEVFVDIQGGHPVRGGASHGGPSHGKDTVQTLCCPVLEVDVADGARLRYTAVQLLGDGTTCIAYQGSRVGRDASLISGSVALGGTYARLRTDSRLVGQGGEANLLAVYFGATDQVLDFRTLQHHEAPRTTSELVFKGAVTDRARSVYSGLIRILNGSRGADARQANRNLVLGDGAHADSVPNLEIEENDVKCSHASAMGPVSEEQRYYLESRGVPPVVADRLIVLGFLSEVLDRLPARGLRAPLRAAFGAKFDASDANQAVSNSADSNSADSNRAIPNRAGA